VLPLYILTSLERCFSFALALLSLPSPLLLLLLLLLPLPFSSRSDSILLLDVGLAAALAVVGGGRGRDLGSVQVGVDGGLVLVQEALEEVVVDERGAVPAGVAQIHQKGQLEGVVEGDPMEGRERREGERVVVSDGYRIKRWSHHPPFPFPPSLPSSLPVEDDGDESLDDGEEGVHHPVHQPVE